MMKTTLLLVAALGCVATAAAQWKNISVSGYDAISYGMFMSDTNTIFISGWGSSTTNDGLILRSTDGGATWSTLHQAADPYIFGVTFSARDTGFVAGYDGACSCAALLETTNAGGVWSEQTFPSSFGFYTTAFPTQTTGFACGYGGVILKTTDAGATWTSLATGTQDVFRVMRFVDDQHGFAVAAYGSDFFHPTEIFKTTNGGSQWLLVKDFKNATIIGGLSFSNASTGFLAGTSGNSAQTILKTTDGGATWTAAWSGPDSSGVVQDIHIDGQFGYAVGDHGLIVHTSDAGATWKNVSHDTSESLLTVYNIGDKAFTAGANGIVLASQLNSSGTLSVMQRLPIAGSAAVFPNPITSGKNATLTLPAGGPFDVRIYDLLGRELSHQFKISGSTTISIPTTAADTFIYRVFDHERVVNQGTFVKQP